MLVQQGKLYAPARYFYIQTLYQRKLPDVEVDFVHGINQIIIDQTRDGAADDVKNAIARKAAIVLMQARRDVLKKRRSGQGTSFSAQRMSRVF